jgi:hypothetical protein
MVLCFFMMCSTAAWSSVFVRWTQPDLPPARDLGISDLVVSWDRGTSSFIKAAHSQGYRVYAEVTLQQAATAAESAEQQGLAGLVLDVADSDRVAGETAFQQLRSAHPNVKFLVLNQGKQPQMRGSLVIKRGSVLEVSSPTAQPWIDTNLALIRVQQRSNPGQPPFYGFSWNGSNNGSNPGQQPAITPTDYSLAVAEACSFRADLMLELEEGMQRALSEQDPQARIFWKQVRSYVDYCAHGEQALEAAANVAVVVDDLDTSDEVMNLLARHNIPFKVFLASDLKVAFEAFDVVVVFAKRDHTAYKRISNIAAHGKTVVVVDAHGTYPWQTHEPVRVNEHTVSYTVGKGRVLELSEPVIDPETFAQDIRRLLGKQNVMSLWNGLTTIAVPYRVHGGTLKVLNLINYAAEPVRVQLQVKGSYSAIRYETPGQECCENLVPVKHDGFTEFVIPDLMIAGRVHLEAEQAADPKAGRRSH